MVELAGIFPEFFFGRVFIAQKSEQLPDEGRIARFLSRCGRPQAEVLSSVFVELRVNIS